MIDPQQAALHAEILQNMAEGICLVRAADGVIIHTNAKFDSMFGYAPQELWGRHVSVVNHPDPIQTAAATAEALMTAIAERGSHSYEVRNLRKDGTAFWSHATASRFEHCEHGLLYVAVHQDITEQKSAERALKSAEARFRAVFEGAYDMILIADQDGRIQAANRRLNEIFGYEAHELVGMSVDSLVPAGLRADHARQRARYLEHPLARPMGVGLELMGVTKKGREIPLEIALSPLEIQEGRFVTAVLRDVTDRKRSEEALRQAIRDREEMVSVVSHDLKTPLSALLLGTQLLQRVPAQDEAGLAQRNRTCQSMERSIANMSRLISDILELGRVRAGMLVLNREPFELDPLLQQSLESVRLLAEEKKIRLELEASGLTRELSIDGRRIEQVMGNLLGNAVKFTPRGGQVWVRAFAHPHAVEVLVQDTGPGIPGESLPRLFERYWQAKETARQGTGLGLAIAKGVIEAHGGRIWAESEVGRGTTIRFLIPIPAAPGLTSAPSEIVGCDRAGAGA